MKTKFTESDIVSLNGALADAIIQTTENIEDIKILNLFEKVANKFSKRIRTMECLSAKVPGELSEKNYLVMYVGNGETATGKKFSLNVGAVNFSPIVETDGKKYALTWNDIVQLAEDKGLFE